MWCSVNMANGEPKIEYQSTFKIETILWSFFLQLARLKIIPVVLLSIEKNQKSC